jgi:hypothetical protein
VNGLDHDGFRTDRIALFISQWISLAILSVHGMRNRGRRHVRDYDRLQESGLVF